MRTIRSRMHPAITMMNTLKARTSARVAEAESRPEVDKLVADYSELMVALCLELGWAEEAEKYRRDMERARAPWP